MTDTELIILAEKTIDLIANIVEAEDKDCLIDIDFQDSILNLTTEQGVFVINKHSVAKEIWLSSPISGPYHFHYILGIWKSRLSKNLIEILQQELKINFHLYQQNFKQLDNSIINI